MPARAEQKIMQNRHEKEFNSPQRKYLYIENETKYLRDGCSKNSWNLPHQK
jgi:hypothetical protein